jgi:hypothetical protein
MGAYDPDQDNSMAELKEAQSIMVEKDDYNSYQYQK